MVTPAQIKNLHDAYDGQPVMWGEQILFLVAVYDAVVEHHKQKADDRCWMDDNILYAKAGLPPDTAHRCVGDKAAMLKNCERFIDIRCGEGKWKTYAELEAEVKRLGSMAREVTCVWCGHQFASTLQSQADHLYQHAKVCEKHPVRKAEAESERLRVALRNLLTVSLPYDISGQRFIDAARAALEDKR